MRVPRLYIWVILAVMSAVLVGVVLFASTAPDSVLHPETGFTLPAPSEIKSIRVVDFVAPEISTRVSFKVPAESWKELLQALSPSERDQDVSVMSAVGTLEIRMVNEEKMSIYLYGLRYNLWFCMGHPGREDYYHGGSLAKLEESLAKARAASRKKGS